MTSVDTRESAGVADIHLVQRLASRLWPLGWHPGGLGWSLARGALADRVVLFESGGEVIAWAAIGAHDEGEILVQAEPRPGLAEDVVRFCLAESKAESLSFEVSDKDIELQQALRAMGAAPDEASPVFGLFSDAMDQEPEESAYRVRALLPGEEQARVDVHRAAWKPATLPYPEATRPDVDPDAESSFTLEAYGAVKQAWLYDPDLDLVAVAADGELAGCCIVWLDPSSGTAEIEPLGVAPAHRRKGLAVALCREAGRRVSQRGGHSMFINTGVRDDYPAPGGAYMKAGFVEERRGVVYRLKRSEVGRT